MAWGLELDDLYGPFQPEPFYASMIMHGVFSRRYKYLTQDTSSLLPEPAISSQDHPGFHPASSCLLFC